MTSEPGPSGALNPNAARRLTGVLPVWPRRRTLVAFAAMLIVCSIGGSEVDTPVKARQQLPRAVRFDPKAIKDGVREVEGFNAKLALVITRSVGTMACAYLFAAIALISLPAAINSGQVIIIVAWIAQTFLQLVLLSIIMVGQSVQAAASDARAAKEFADTETILDRLDVNTAGGIRDVLDAIHALGPPSGESHAASPPG